MNKRQSPSPHEAFPTIGDRQSITSCQIAILPLKIKQGMRMTNDGNTMLDGENRGDILEEVIFEPKFE